MGSTRYVKDSRGFIIGKIDDSGATATGITTKGTYIGMYVKGSGSSEGYTMRPSGERFCFGDGLAALIFEENQRNPL